MKQDIKRNNGIFYGEHVEIFPEISDTVSATECTGLMPTPPKTPEEYEAYQSLHSMGVPKKLPGKREIHEGVYDDRPLDVRY